MITYVLKGNHFVSGILSDTEGFTTDIIMTSCPPGANQYITPKGDTNCCEGDIVNKQCNGSTICSLSPKPPGGLQSCSDWINKNWKERAARFCPNSMYNYYGPIQRVAGGKDEGCSRSGTANDGSKPMDITQPRCKIYSTEAEEYSKVDSCFNQKALDAMTTRGHKSIVPTGGDNIALLISTGIPEDGSSVVPTTCYDFDRAIVFLQKNNPYWVDMLKKDPCALGKGLMCGVKCRPPNPTGYTMSGDGIQGEIDVQMVFKMDGHGTQLIYVAENNNSILWVNIDGEGKQGETFSFNGSLSNISGIKPGNPKDMDALMKIFKYIESLGNAANMKGANLKVKSVAENPTGYEMWGDDISITIPVQKIVSGEFPSGSQLTLYFAQNGSNIAGVLTLISDPSRILNGASFPGKLSDNNFTDIPSYLKTDLARKFDGAPKKKYKVRKI